MTAKSFEQNLSALEKIVEKLESGSPSLDEAIELFQKGKSLAKACEGRLKEAELKIRKLVEGEDGNPTTTEFEAPPVPDEEPDEEDEEDKA
jgi:exodeoxyribonuclease VII small subunit